MYVTSIGIRWGWYNTRMYEIESSTGYVLSYYNAGEADRRYKILTPERGIVIGTATSVRKEQSKLKYFLQRYNYVQFEYVHGKGGYRFTGGQLLDDTSRRLSRDALSVVARISLLVERLTQDQDEETNLFEIMKDGINSLTIQSKFESEDIQNDESQITTIVQTLQAKEHWTVARVLVAFGYFDVGELPGIHPEIYQQSTLSDEDILLFIHHEKHLERYIRQCVTETML